jgi:DNA-directed RNA polymerase subunit M/transcription elongation factor TFIIS
MPDCIDCKSNLTHKRSIDENFNRLEILICPNCGIKTIITHHDKKTVNIKSWLDGK